MTTTTATELRDGTWTVPVTARATFRARSFGIRTVTGTLEIERGTVRVSGGRPVAAEGTLTAASVATGIPQRDRHLCGPQFFDAERHPAIRVLARGFERAGDGWTVPAVLTVAGADTTVTLHARRLPDREPGAVTIRVTGELDRTTTPIKAPRITVGRRIVMEAELTFTRR